MRRIEQTNELLKERLAYLISREIPLDNGLITIAYVECSPDLRSAKIVVSVLPANLAGTALEKLRRNASMFSESLRKKTRLRQIPKFYWTIDATEKKAAELEKIFKSIKNKNI